MRFSLMVKEGVSSSKRLLLVACCFLPACLLTSCRPAKQNVPGKSVHEAQSAPPVPAPPIASAPAITPEQEEDHEERCSLPSYSPDGKTLVFVKRLPEDEAGLYLVNADGTHPRKIPNTTNDDTLPRFSPDGKRLLFFSFEKKFPYLIDLDGQNRKLVAPIKVGYATFIPNGKQIAYISFEPWGDLIEVMDLNGEFIREIPNTYRANDFAFSPDGKKLVYSTEREYRVGELYLVNSNGKGLKSLRKGEEGGGNSAVFSPDGSKLYFTQGAEWISELYVMNVDGSGVKKLTPRKDPKEYNPSVSPDGKSLVFHAFEGPETDETLTMYIMKVDGSNRRPLLKQRAKGN